MRRKDIQPQRGSNRFRHENKQKLFFKLFFPAFPIFKH